MSEHGQALIASENHGSRVSSPMNGKRLSCTLKPTVFPRDVPEKNILGWMVEAETSQLNQIPCPRSWFHPTRDLPWSPGPRHLRWNSTGKGT